MADLRIAFAGTPIFARTILAALCQSNLTPQLVLTQPDRPKGRGRALQASPVKQLAQELALPIDQPVTLRDRENLQLLEQAAPDVLVVAAYGLILPAQVLSLPRFGCINVHASLLPRWRGAAPIERAIMAGDQETGVCIMQMEEGLDTGPVFAQQSVSIKPEYTAQPLEQILANIGAELLIDALQKLPLAALPQPQEGATYATKLTNKDRLVDWQRNADAISRQIRALCDRMPVRCDINGAVMQIVAARVTKQSDLQTTKGQPGTIIKASKDALVVQCGQDGLAITQLKLNRGKGQIMDANAALNGHKDILYAGAVFDSTLAPPT